MTVRHEKLNMNSVSGRKYAYYIIARSYIEKNNAIKWTDYSKVDKRRRLIKSDINFFSQKKFNTPLSGGNINSVLDVMTAMLGRISGGWDISYDSMR